MTGKDAKKIPSDCAGQRDVSQSFFVSEHSSEVWRRPSFSKSAEFPEWAEMRPFPQAKRSFVAGNPVRSSTTRPSERAAFAAATVHEGSNMLKTAALTGRCNTRGFAHEASL